MIYVFPQHDIQCQLDPGMSLHAYTFSSINLPFVEFATEADNLVYVAVYFQSSKRECISILFNG